MAQHWHGLCYAGALVYLSCNVLGAYEGKQNYLKKLLARIEIVSYYEHIEQRNRQGKASWQKPQSKPLAFGAI
jgi:hypothetical protein